MKGSRDHGTNLRAQGLSPRQLGISPRQLAGRPLRQKKVRVQHVPRDAEIRRGLRFEVLKRDRFTCTYCGANGAGVELHVDHVLATANGGKTVAANLTTACRDCNLGKGARLLSEVTL